MVQIRKLDKIAQEIKSLDIDDLNYLFDAVEKDKKIKISIEAVKQNQEEVN